MQLADSMYGRWRMPSTALRTTRDVPGASKIPRIAVMLQRPGPATATMLISSTSAGNEIQMSTSRWTVRSTQPP